MVKRTKKKFCFKVIAGKINLPLVILVQQLFFSIVAELMTARKDSLQFKSAPKIMEV